MIKAAGEIELPPLARNSIAAGGGDAVPRLALALQVQGVGFRVLVAHKPCVSLNSRFESNKEEKNEVGRTLEQS